MLLWEKSYCDITDPQNSYNLKPLWQKQDFSVGKELWSIIEITVTK